MLHAAITVALEIVQLWLIVGAFTALFVMRHDDDLYHTWCLQPLWWQAICLIGLVLIGPVIAFEIGRQMWTKK